MRINLVHQMAQDPSAHMHVRLDLSVDVPLAVSNSLKSDGEPLALGLDCPSYCV